MLRKIKFQFNSNAPERGHIFKPQTLKNMFTQESIKEFLADRPGLTMRSLSLEAGLSESLFGKILRGQRGLTPETIEKLAPVLNKYGYRVRNLFEITGKESGIVVYNTNEGILCNWQSIKGFPRLFINNIMGLGEEIQLPIKTYICQNITEELDGVTLIYCAMSTDEFNEEFRNPLSATVYEFEDETKVYIPEGWV